MATNKSIEQIQQEIEQLEGQEEDLESEVSGVASDQYKLKKEKELSKIRNQLTQLESSEASKKWYDDGFGNKEEEKGLLGRAIEASTAPGYAIAGLTEQALGKGDTSGFIDEVKQNVTENEGFGTMLEKFGAPKSVQLPVGFAMDVAFDPLAWATGGTTTAAGRIASGAAKAGVKGAAKGASSRALEIASTLSKPGKWVGKKEASENLAKKAREATDDFYKLTQDKTVEEVMQDGVAKIRNEGTLPGRFSQYLDKKITQRGGYLARVRDSFKYDRGHFNRKWAQGNTADDIAEPQTAAEAELAAVKGVDTNNILEKWSKGSEESVDAATRNAKHDAAQALELAREPAGDAPISSGVSAQRLDEEYLRHKKSQKAFQKVNELGKDKYGIGWVDDIVTKVDDTKYAKKAVDFYDKALSFFKVSKVGASPTAYFNAAAGNPTMALMSGIDITRPGYWKEVKDAFKVSLGKYDKENLTKLQNTMRNTMENHPQVMKDIFGISPNEALNAKDIMDIAEDVAGNKDFKIEMREAAEDVLEGNVDEWADDVVAKFQSVAKQQGTDEVAKGLGGADEMRKATDPVRQAIAGEGTRVSILGEIFNRRTSNWVKSLKNQAENTEGAKSSMYKLLHGYMTKPMSYYEKIDMGYRLGLATHIRKNGLTQRELTKLKRFIPMKKSDVTQIEGTNKFRLSERAAANAASETYLNYQAIPPAIRLLRNMPLIGAPFASFVASMSDKTARTIMYNPDAFSKVKFALDEMENLRSESEEKGMQNKYNKWLENTPTARLPFFERHPVYVNVANTIPFMSLNMFKEGDRKYEDSLGGDAAKVVDKLPLLDDPVGQTLWNYLVMPAIYQESSNVRGQFGQRLWPKDADFTDTTGYLARSIAQSFSPGAADLGGFAHGVVTDEGIDIIPSYGYRKNAYATQGKTSVGYKGKEEAISRTARAIVGSVMGMKYYTPNITYD